MGILENELNRCAAIGAVVDLYRERLVDEPLSGRVLQVSEELVVLQLLDDACRHAGICAVRLPDVSRLVHGNRELLDQARVAEPIVWTEVGEIVDIPSAVEALAQRYTVVLLHTERIAADVAIVGALVAADAEHILLSALGAPRTLDRYTVVLALDEITRVEVDSPYLLHLQDLHGVGPA
jgi:hypothetical protein